MNWLKNKDVCIPTQAEDSINVLAVQSKALMPRRKIASPTVFDQLHSYPTNLSNA